MKIKFKTFSLNRKYYKSANICSKKNVPDQKRSFRTEKKHPVCKYQKMEEAKSTNPTPEGICKPES